MNERSGYAGSQMQKTTSLRVTIFHAGLIAACMFVSCRGWAQLTPRQAAGKKIYTEGVSPSNAVIEAILGDGSTRVPARLMPCASCHGPDGKGRPEGGVVPSDITWETLTRPLWSANRLDRRRPEYDEKSLRRSITDAVDSAGTELGITMPHFSMLPADLDSLVDYLKLLGRQPAPGVEEESIRVATMIPAGGPLAPLGHSFAALLRAWLDELNQQGGIYGRRIDLQIIEVSGTPDRIAAQARDFLRENRIFAVIGVLAPGAEKDLIDLLEKEGVPVVSTMAAATPPGEPYLSKTFYILSGLTQQSSVLAKFARSRNSDDSMPPATVVFPDSRRELALALIEDCRQRALPAVERLEYSKFDAGALAGSLAQKNVREIFFLGSGRELQELLQAAEPLRWDPTVFQPGPLAGPEVFNIPARFGERVFLTLPTLPSDLTPEALGEYGFLAKKYALSSPQPALSMGLLAGMKVFTEGLRQSGRQLSRERFVQSLSGLVDFQTGVAPVLSYGPARRIGALGAYVVKLDLKNRSYVQVDSWITP